MISGDVLGGGGAGATMQSSVERIVDSSEGCTNLRRFPGLAQHYSPRAYVRRVPQVEVFSGRMASPRRTGGGVTATRTLNSERGTTEADRRQNGPLAAARQNLWETRSSTWSELSPRNKAQLGFPRGRPAFTPCNPSQAKESIARPRCQAVSQPVNWRAATTDLPPP